ncbi:MAG TPA: class III lanthionine synthetase LanKC [Pseudonocardiaceae bacterium]
MIEQYELYCMADRFFYDTADRHRAARGVTAPATPMAELPAGGRVIGEGDDGDFALCSRPVPESWDHQPSDSWMYYAPQGVPIPAQGWKIHVSSGLRDAERVLDTIWDYCVAAGLPFKYLRSRAVMVMFNSKAAFRGSSGKLVTIYPGDLDELRLVLGELAELLEGVEGPYILSDLRIGPGPLFVRYGAFTERWCLSPGGERVLALEDGEGTLVPDVRGPTFALPPWVTLPDFLEPHLVARNAVTTTGLPYTIQSVLHFSNGGGVYLATDNRDGARVVLKEGRPLAGLDALGRDAVTRLTHERDMLERLRGLDVVPAVRDYFTLGEHHFLVQEFVDGNPLQRKLVQRYPLTSAECTDESLAEYTEWALGAADQVERAVGELHARGVVFGDLHPANILVTDEGRMVLIDFEVASLAEDRQRSALAHPAFLAPSGRVGVDTDHYALACLRLGLFAPQTTMMLPLHPAKVSQLADVITATFPVPREAIDHAVRVILGTEVPQGEHPLSHDPAVLRALPMPGAPDTEWTRTRDAMARAIVASATPDRDDRLFPGDIEQFRPGGGLNLAHGAAGVLWAMSVTGCAWLPEHEDWLRKRALDPPHDIRPGFWTGLHGIAYALEALGHRQDALDVLHRGLHGDWSSPEPSLYSGLSGIGLNLLHFAAVTGDATLAETAATVVAHVAERLGGPQDVPEISGGDHPRAGLMHGSSGPALLLVHAYERTGDPALLDRAADALRQDLRRCVTGADGAVQVNQGWRTLPYLDEGSAGIALVLRRYLAHRPDDDELATALRGLDLVTRCGYFVQPGLFTGRAGLITAAAARPGERPDAGAVALVRGLAWHALPYADGLAFPGDQLLRLSMDLATGTAGALFATGAALGERPLHLPFLEPGPAPAPHRPAVP